MERITTITIAMPQCLWTRYSRRETRRHPFEQPTRYYLVINRKTANRVGVKNNPGELLTRADKVIE
jgi:hypothetical protein